MRAFTIALLATVGVAIKLQGDPVDAAEAKFEAALKKIEAELKMQYKKVDACLKKCKKPDDEDEDPCGCFDSPEGQAALAEWEAKSQAAAEEAFGDLALAQMAGDLPLKKKCEKDDTVCLDEMAALKKEQAEGASTAKKDKTAAKKAGMEAKDELDFDDPCELAEDYDECVAEVKAAMKCMKGCEGVIDCEDACWDIESEDGDAEAAGDQAGVSLAQDDDEDLDDDLPPPCA